MNPHTPDYWQDFMTSLPSSLLAREGNSKHGSAPAVDQNVGRAICIALAMSSILERPFSPVTLSLLLNMLETAQAWRNFKQGWDSFKQAPVPT